jgi:hypothetical protein
VSTTAAAWLSGWWPPEADLPQVGYQDPPGHEGEWRLAYRETVLYGHVPAVTYDPSQGELNWFTDSAKTDNHAAILHVP